MSVRATGTFEVKLAPQWQDDAPGSALGRLAIDKQFRGQKQHFYDFEYSLGPDPQ